VKSIMPTTGRTFDLQQLDPAIKRRAAFSARTTSVGLLQKYRDLEDGLLTGQLDQATARLNIKQMLAEMGYMPDPEQIGTLQDLSSDSRIDLKLETDVQTAQGYGWDLQGQDPDVLDEWPAQELYRAFGPKDPKNERDWAARWERAGGQFFDGRMIALKNDPIWDRIGSPDLFDDALGNPWPPFAFNSGMDVRDIDRDEAVALGLIDADTQIFPKQIDLNEGLQASPDVRAADLRAELEQTGLGHFQGDTFVFGPGTST
jgi:hypothetical protein